VNDRIALRRTERRAADVALFNRQMKQLTRQCPDVVVSRGPSGSGEHQTAAGPRVAGGNQDFNG
jgi:hypothetical protein